MPGVRVYRRLGDALRDGFRVYDRTETGYLIRRSNADNTRHELAIVDCTLSVEDPDREC